MSSDEIDALRGLGPKSLAMLQKVGIHDIQVLRQLGAVQAYWRVKQSDPRASLNLLWALEGALSDRAWQDVARDSRLELLLKLEDLQTREMK